MKKNKVVDQTPEVLERYGIMWARCGPSRNRGLTQNELEVLDTHARCTCVDCVERGMGRRAAWRCLSADMNRTKKNL